MKYPPDSYKMPENYRVLRSLDWVKVTIPQKTAYEWEIWNWLGDNAIHNWSYRDNIESARNYYFENKQDAEWFVLRWS
jgi:hypothetical protein